MDWLKAALYGLGMDGRRIRAARMARGLSLKAVGERMGVTAQAVAQWEKSSPQFDPDKLQRLSDALRVDMEWLTRKTEDNTVPSIEHFELKNHRTPVLYTKEQAFLFFIFSRIDKKQNEKLPSIEPSVAGSKNTFSVSIEEGDEFDVLRSGNLAVFDVDVEPRDHDIVLAFSLENARYSARYARFRDIKNDIIDADKLFVARNMAHHYSPGETTTFSGMVMMGVLIELRWLRPAEGDPRASREPC